jgi:SAM-dependent methyltransferase
MARQELSVQNCPLCDGSCQQLVAYQHLVLYLCKRCDVHFRTFDSRDHHQDHFAQVDSEAYSRSIQVLRERSYPKLVQTVQGLVNGGRWLDVGCSFGWLLDYVRGLGFQPYGIEPSSNAADAALKKDLPVEIGTYPETRAHRAPFQVISFMDVLEHLPTPQTALIASYQDLASSGVLVIQVPDRECFMYNVALQIYKISRGKLGMPLKRLYLYGLDFPHVYYFSNKSMKALLNKYGFQVIREYRASTGDWKTMTDRVSYLEQGVKKTSLTKFISFGARLLQFLDNTRGHGGLLVLFCQKQIPEQILMPLYPSKEIE